MEIETMNKHFVLAVAVFGGVFVATGADLSTNKLMIGDEEVDRKMVGDRWIASDSYTLVQVHAEINPPPKPLGASEAKPSSETNSEPCLRLLLSTGYGETKFGGVKGLHGLIYMASDWRTPSLAQTNLVDILSSDDKTRIVVMVADNGPIYSSTNSGMTWKVINTPGTYEFPLTIGLKGGGWIAAATIHPSPENQSAANSSVPNWYAVASAPDGSKMVMTEDPSQPAPALTIRHSGGGVVISWPAAFTGFVLQVNSDLSSTNWVDVTDPVNKLGEQNQVLISSPAANNFYRLKSQ
jgi:hypothetical protein